MNEQFIIKKREVVGSMSFSKAQLNAFNKYGDRFTRKKRQAKKNKKKAFARMLNSTLKGIKMSAAEYYEQELEKINMSESKYKSAFPTYAPGMSLKEYAAIRLKVPESGIPWLDEMIQKSRRDEFAKAYLSVAFNNEEFLRKAQSLSIKKGIDFNLLISKSAYETADAMIKEADEGMGEK